MNLATLAAGVLVLAVGLLARAGVATALLTRRASHAVQRPSRVADALARAGSPPSGVTGVRLALQRGRGPAAVPLRSTLLGTGIAVAAVTMAVTFGASLQHLLDTPTLQGWNWDVVVGNPHVLGDPTENAQIAERLTTTPGVGEVSAATFGRVSVGNVETSIVAIDARKGSIFPPVLEGREPRQATEVVLGRDLLRRVHRHIGDDVTVTDPAGKHHRLRIVGTGLFPTAVASTGNVEGVAPGEGAVVTMDFVRAVQPDAPVHQVFVRYDVRADPGATYQRLRRTFGPSILRPLRSSDLDNVAAVAWMPYALAAVLLAFGLAAVGHLLVTSVRRRRRDLAVLKTLGFVRRQILSTVAWQATTLIAVAVLVGMPVGVALGRTAWQVAADQLGVVARPVAPSLLLLAVPAAVIIANLIAAVPAWTAGRIHPAVVLRTE